MVYNYNSLWVHLYTAFVVQIEKQKYKNMTILDAFKYVTDGPQIAQFRIVINGRFLKKMEPFGFSGIFKGASMSLHELELLPKRVAALNSRIFG